MTTQGGNVSSPSMARPAGEKYQAGERPARCGDAAEHEYVEFLIDVKDGEVVSCEFYGEGRQVDPITEPVILRPLDDAMFSRYALKHFKNKIYRALRCIGAQSGERA